MSTDTMIKVSNEMDLLNSFVVFDPNDSKWKLDLSGEHNGKRGQFKKSHELINAVCELYRDDSGKLVSHIRTIGIAKVGERGPQGPEGPAGAPGGPPGPKGDKGDRGDGGTPGEKGSKGDKGDQGSKGDQGVAGINGTNGIDGKPGRDGKDGSAGLNGKDGAPGKDGSKGDKGDKGDQGTQGIQGNQGPSGISGWIKAIPADEFRLWEVRELRAQPAVLDADPRSPTLAVLRFDDTDTMTCGGYITFPSAAKKCRIRLRAKHTQMPLEEKLRYGVLKMQIREITEEGTGQWREHKLEKLAFPYTERGREIYREFHRDIDFGSSSKFKAGVDYQFLLLREKDPDDTLIGDLMLQSMSMEVE